jgi:2-polyprenyl-3-methyl-5-hydroxy-6-metoxy-1,4-benzoquinol methylase
MSRIAGAQRLADTAEVADCCDPEDCQSVFSRQFARRTAKRYRSRGLSPAADRMVQFLDDQGLPGASVLEIGGGVGEIQVELLRRGASRVTNLELSTQYEDEAAQLLDDAGLAGRVDRRFLDIAREPEMVESADVVVLHRVVCCYPDYQRLLSAAARHATQAMVFSYPPGNAATRALTWSENLARRLRGNTFRGYLHSPAAMIGAAEAHGLHVTYRHHSWDWDVVGLVR